VRKHNTKIQVHNRTIMQSPVWNVRKRIVTKQFIKQNRQNRID
jgi:hypothetical protein